MKSVTRNLLALSAVLGLLFPFVALADSGKEHGSGTGMTMEPSMGQMEAAPPKQQQPTLKADLPSLLAEVERLRKEVAELNAIRPTFTGFMPEFSERFHVMHFAGDAGDWAVANHEAKELDRLLAVAQVIDPQKGKLMRAFMGDILKKLDDAIVHGDKAAFGKQLGEMVQRCNACHVAVGSPFIRVSVDVPPDQTPRHPHILTKQRATEHPHMN
ncbi:MAG: hypothetical protein HY423_00135 [Candidatus Lambdaproteobacteria bacterium]|nr:hypothetical protein [Candidatus Lambdaproteobacteria bacterium]